MTAMDSDAITVPVHVTTDSTEPVGASAKVALEPDSVTLSNSTPPAQVRNGAQMSPSTKLRSSLSSAMESRSKQTLNIIGFNNDII